MNIYNSIDEFSGKKGIVVTIGTFDGVHIGHRQIINNLLNSARKLKCDSMVITFNPHPRNVIRQENKTLKLLTTIKEKTRLLSELGVDNLVVQPFNKGFSNLSPEEFVCGILLQKIDIRKLIIGYNHKFGKNRTGSYEDLKEISRKYSFEVEVVPEFTFNTAHVSSTRIREAIAYGRMEDASSMLGYDYSLEGVVEKGNGEGRTLGFPTANLLVSTEKLIPSNGVYAVIVGINNQLHNGMLNIGHRPTMYDNSSKTIEVHLIEFDKDIYLENLTVYFKKRIRNEIRFTNKQQLISQLNIDKHLIMELLTSKGDKSNA